jgi:hypothetical protein
MPITSIRNPGPQKRVSTKSACTREQVGKNLRRTWMMEMWVTTPTPTVECGAVRAQQREVCTWTEGRMSVNLLRFLYCSGNNIHREMGFHFRDYAPRGRG